MKSIVVLIGVLLLFISCSKKEYEELPPAVYSSTPAITASVSSTNIQQFDDLIFNIFYRDGDGDIGNKDIEIHSLEIVDLRAGITYDFHVPPQSALSNVVVEGVLSVNLENVILLDQDNASETAVFEIRLKDAAGNWSNQVKSPTVTITK